MNSARVTATATEAVVAAADASLYPFGLDSSSFWRWPPAPSPFRLAVVKEYFCKLCLPPPQVWVPSTPGFVGPIVIVPQVQAIRLCLNVRPRLVRSFSDASSLLVTRTWQALHRHTSVSGMIN